MTNAIHCNAFVQDILGSRVGVCGVSEDHRDPGVVVYGRILHHTENDKSIRVDGKDFLVGSLKGNMF